jgi:hypothetical protein
LGDGRPLAGGALRGPRRSIRSGKWVGGRAALPRPPAPRPPPVPRGAGGQPRTHQPNHDQCQQRTDVTLRTGTDRTTPAADQPPRPDPRRGEPVFLDVQPAAANAAWHANADRPSHVESPAPRAGGSSPVQVGLGEPVLPAFAVGHQCGATPRGTGEPRRGTAVPLPRRPPRCCRRARGPVMSPLVAYRCAEWNTCASGSTGARVHQFSTHRHACALSITG